MGECVPFEVLQQREEGHDVGVGQGAQEVHHAVLLGCWVWESCRGKRKRLNSVKRVLWPQTFSWWAWDLNMMTAFLRLKSHLCPPWKRGRGGRWAEAPAAPWSKAWVFLQWRWCPCHSASRGYLWYLRGIRGESRSHTTKGKLCFKGSWLNGSTEEIDWQCLQPIRK